KASGGLHRRRALPRDAESRSRDQQRSGGACDARELVRRERAVAARCNRGCPGVGALSLLHGDVLVLLQRSLGSRRLTARTVAGGLRVHTDAARLGASATAAPACR